MAAVIVRNLPESVHRALKLRAAQNGCSTEAEIRAILEQAVSATAQLKIGSELAAFGRQLGGEDFAPARDQTPADAAVFE